MRLIFDYLRLILFVGGALVGVQIPSFVGQYEDQLKAHLSESSVGLEAFQKDADRFFGGNIPELIQHYRKNDDPVFNDGGESIYSLFERNRLLRHTLNEFTAEFYSPYWHTLNSPLPEIRNKAWAGYDFSVTLNLNGILWALGIGFVLSMFIDLLLALPRALWSTTTRQGSNKKAKRPPVFEHDPPEF